MGIGKYASAESLFTLCTGTAFFLTNEFAIYSCQDEIDKFILYDIIFYHILLILITYFSE